MLASVFIIAVSSALFVYWFRYTCMLILSTKSGKDYAKHVATANHLSFLDTREQLSAAADHTRAPLDGLHRSLDRDYRLVSYLLRHAAGYQSGGISLEHYLLRLDYKLMSAWYRLVRKVSSSLARGALLEMATIVSHLANNMGRRAAELG